MNASAISNDGDANSLPARRVEGTIERIVTAIPAPKTHAVPHPDHEASQIARRAAQRAAVLSGSLALPPGPLGMLTVLPDLYLIWHTQRQMVADIFELYGRTPELTRTHMLYCLFRHAASQVLRDVAVRVGPLDGRDPQEMFAGLKGAALLGPFRGEPAADVGIAAEMLLRLQALATDFPAIQEVEVNPLILSARGKRSAAVDGRLRLGP